MIRLITVNGETVPESQIKAIRYVFEYASVPMDEKELEENIITHLLLAQYFDKSGKTLPPKKLANWMKKERDLFPAETTPEDYDILVRIMKKASLVNKEIRKSIHISDEQYEAYRQEKTRRIKDGEIIFIQRIFKEVSQADPATATAELLHIRDQSVSDEDFLMNYILSVYENSHFIRTDPHWIPTIAIDQDRPITLPEKTLKMLCALKPGELSDIVDEGERLIWFGKRMSNEEAIVQDKKNPSSQQEIFEHFAEKAISGKLDSLKKNADIHVESETEK